MGKTNSTNGFNRKLTLRKFGKTFYVRCGSRQPAADFRLDSWVGLQGSMIMLAEIFMLRAEADARSLKAMRPVGNVARFVPIELTGELRRG